MAEIPKIFSAINAVMRDLGAVTKDKRNQQHGFNYRGVDDVMNALNPQMVKHNLFCVPEVIRQEREERKTAKGNNLIYSIVTMRYTLYAEDGSSIQAVVIGEGMDSGDKATNKAMAIAYKYAMFQIFSIPTEETAPDPDQTTPDESEPTVPRLICAMCKGSILSLSDKNGVIIKDAQGVAEFTEKESGKKLCYGCYKAWKAEGKR